VISIDVGIEPLNAVVIIPFRKPKGEELNHDQKNCNQIISGIRGKVKHAIGKVKRLRIVKEKIRLGTNETRDLAMVITCSIHNFKNARRNTCNHL